MSQIKLTTEQRAVAAWFWVIVAGLTVITKKAGHYHNWLVDLFLFFAVVNAAWCVVMYGLALYVDQPAAEDDSDDPSGRRGGGYWGGPPHA